MKSVSGFIFFLFLFKIAAAQEERAVPLFSVNAVPRWINNDMSVIGQPVNDEGAIIPASLVKGSFRIWSFCLDEAQDGYSKYVKDGRKDSAFLKKIKWNRWDTTKLASRFLKNKVDLLVHLQSKNRLMVIADLNGDKNFRNDTALYYSLSEKESSLPCQIVEIETWEAGGIKKAPVSVKWVPWVYNSFFEDHPPVGLDSLTVLVGTCQYQSGSVSIGGVDHSINVYSNSPQVRFSPSRSVKIAVTTNNKEKPSIYIAGQDFEAGHLKMNFSRVGLLGDSLYLKGMGVATSDRGIDSGKYAINIKIKDYLGRPFELDSFRGRYVLLDFWGSWCVPCIEGFKVLKRLNQEYSRNLTIVSIASESNPQNGVAMWKKQGATWISLIENSSDPNTITNRFLLPHLPMYILIDPKGKIISRNEGIDVIQTKYLGNL